MVPTQRSDSKSRKNELEKYLVLPEVYGAALAERHELVQTSQKGLTETAKRRVVDAFTQYLRDSGKVGELNMLQRIQQGAGVVGG